MSGILKVCGGLVLLGVCGWVTLRVWPLLSTAQPGPVGAAGILISGWGLLISVVGFAFTIWQLVRTRRSSDAVSAALEGARHHYGAFNALNELRTAIATSSITVDLISVEKWGEAAIHHQTIFDSVTRLTSSKNHNLDDSIMERLKDAVPNIQDVQDQLRKSALVQPASTTASRMASAVQRGRMIMLSIEQGLLEELQNNGR